MNTFNDLQEKHPDLQFVPLSDKKVPIVEGWQVTRKKYDFTNAKGIGLVCGSISGNVEAVDIDCKYDLTTTLFTRYKQAVNEADKDLLKMLVVQKTRSGGYHFIYRCDTITGNTKLANRHVSIAEKEKNPNEKVKVLLETRGEKGQIAVSPMDGYSFIYGDLSKIKKISPEQRGILWQLARSFNEVKDEYKPAKRQEKKQIKGLTPFEDYNNRADVIALLEKHGWKVTGEKGRKKMLLRPGETSSLTSGNFDEEKNWLSVFSSSTEFDTETAYLPYAVYAFLECEKDFNKAAKNLYDLGYGDRIEKAKDNDSQTPSRVDLLDDDYSFIASGNDYDEYLNQWRSNTFEMGLSTGFEELDKHFVFKRGNLVVINGHDNVGKSTVIWYLAMLSAMLHGWNWIIFSSENSVGNVVRKLIEFYWCEQIHAMTDAKFDTAKKFVEDHFAIIKCDNELYNYRDILNMAKKLGKKNKYDSLLIDPYNSLKIELTSSSKLSTHEYHYEAVSEMKLFTKQNDCCIYLNCHAVTFALRQVGADKMATAPQKADTEGGGKFSNKADDFLTIHRKVQHPEEFMFSEIHVRKIKETETGGRTTPFDSPIKIKMVRGLVGFEYQIIESNYDNPVLNFHSKAPKQKLIKLDHNMEAVRMPYADSNENPF